MASVRIAMVADIHGNFEALQAVLDDARREGADAIAVLGDIVNGGPEPQRCWRAVRERAAWILRGNHERYVLAAAAGEPTYLRESFGPARWTADRLTGGELEELTGLPVTVALDVSDAPPTLLCHASPRRDDDMILADTPARDVSPMLAGVTRETVVRGHNHDVFDRRIDGVRVIGLGSVGLPFTTPPQAQYAILEGRGHRWSVDHRQVPYDVGAAVRACRSTGYLDEAGPVARLFAMEIATGRRHLSPFMRDVYVPGDHRSLSEAVDLFLGPGSP